MLKYFPLLIILLTPSVKADIYHSISSSVKLEVSAAATAADRIGNSMSISGSGVNTTDGTTTGSSRWSRNSHKWRKCLYTNYSKSADSR